MVLTSHDALGDTGKKTGCWLEEFAAPYYAFTAAGADVTVCSPRGGAAPLDPKSQGLGAHTVSTRRFAADADAQAVLAGTAILQEMSASVFDAVFYPGGHGPMWDLVENPFSIRLIETMLADGKPVVAVCHGAGALRRAKTPAGEPVVQGKAVTGFADSEERAVGLSDVVPFRIEAMLRSAGGVYSKRPDWQPHVVSDGPLITGQNPASAQPAARLLLERLGLVAPVAAPERTDMFGRQRRREPAGDA